MSLFNNHTAVLAYRKSLETILTKVFRIHHSNIHRITQGATKIRYDHLNVSLLLKENTHFWLAVLSINCPLL